MLPQWITDATHLRPLLGRLRAVLSPTDVLLVMSDLLSPGYVTWRVHELNAPCYKDPSSNAKVVVTSHVLPRDSSESGFIYLGLGHYEHGLPFDPDVPVDPTQPDALVSHRLALARKTIYDPSWLKADYLDMVDGVPFKDRVHGPYRRTHHLSNMGIRKMCVLGSRKWNRWFSTGTSGEGSNSGSTNGSPESRSIRTGSTYSGLLTVCVLAMLGVPGCVLAASKEHVLHAMTSVGTPLLLLSSLLVLYSVGYGLTIVLGTAAMSTVSVPLGVGVASIALVGYHLLLGPAALSPAATVGMLSDPYVVLGATGLLLTAVKRTQRYWNVVTAPVVPAASVGWTACVLPGVLAYSSGCVWTYVHLLALVATLVLLLSTSMVCMVLAVVLLDLASAIQLRVYLVGSSVSQVIYGLVQVTLGLVLWSALLLGYSDCVCVLLYLRLGTCTTVVVLQQLYAYVSVGSVSSGLLGYLGSSSTVQSYLVTLLVPVHGSWIMRACSTICVLGAALGTTALAASRSTTLTLVLAVSTALTVLTVYLLVGSVALVPAVLAIQLGVVLAATSL